MHPILAEIIRCKEAPRPDVLRRWQQQIRTVIAPLVEAGESAQRQAAAKGAPKSKVTA